MCNGAQCPAIIAVQTPHHVLQHVLTVTLSTYSTVTVTYKVKHP